MRVLHVFKTYLPDGFAGVEHVIWEIAEGTSDLGVTSSVFALSSNPSPRPIAVGRHTVHQARQDAYVASTGVSFSAFDKFRALAASVDLIHYHFPWPFMDLLHLCTRPAVPAMVTYHSDIVRQKLSLKLYSPLLTRFMDSVERVVVTSPNYAGGSEVLPRYMNKTSVIPIGLSERVPPDTQTVENLRQTIGSGFLLFVGALRYYKGISFLIEAARFSGVPTVIAGDGEFRRQIEEARIPNVTFVGPVNDATKEALLELCSGFVFPSHLRSEAFGVALLEAARAGRAMISCEIGTGTTYVNLNNVTGFSVPPADPSALADAMAQLWHSKSLQRDFGRAARARYEQLFTAEEMCAAYLMEYQRLLSSARS